MRPKPKRRLPPEVLCQEEVGRLLEAVGNGTWRALRDRALLAVLYRSGLRIAEALSPRPKDLDLANGAVRVLCGKGGSSRTVGIDPVAASIVSQWLDEWLKRASRPGSPMKPTATLFCTRTGNRMKESFTRRLLPRLARKAGIRADGSSVGYGLARWDGSSWEGMSDNVFGYPSDFVMHDGSLVVGGQFRFRDNGYAFTVARWSGNSWIAFGRSDGDTSVSAIDVLQDGTLIAGGSFHAMNDMPAHGLARWDGES